MPSSNNLECFIDKMTRSKARLCFCAKERIKSRVDLHFVYIVCKGGKFSDVRPKHADHGGRDRRTLCGALLLRLRFFSLWVSQRGKPG